MRQLLLPESPAEERHGEHALEPRGKCTDRVLPNEYLTCPKPSHTFVYISTIKHFEAFIDAYGKDPNDPSQRKDTSHAGRFRTSHLSASKERDDTLDITWLKDESWEDSNEQSEPQDLASEAITDIEALVGKEEGLTTDYTDDTDGKHRVRTLSA